jgi:CubicO group peptidase (beta-lactamase class C family)
VSGKGVNNLYFQPVMPVSLTENWNLLTRPVMTLYQSVPYPTATGGTERTTTFGDTILAQVLEIEPRLSREAATLFDTEGRVIPYYTFDEWGSGRVWSTAHDLVRFGMFHLKEKLTDQKPILRVATIDRMVNEHRITGSVGGFFGTDWFYGLGWGGREKTLYNPKWYGHEGGMPGVSAQLKLFPAERVAVAILSNGRRNLTYQLIDTVAEVLIPPFAAQRTKDPTRRYSHRKRAVRAGRGTCRELAG